MFKIEVPYYGQPQVSITLIGIISMRVFRKIADRLKISETEALTQVQDYINNARGVLALPTTLGDSNRFLFAPIEGDNKEKPFFSVTSDFVQQLHSQYPELVPPTVKTEKELFEFIIPDFVTIH